MTVISTPWDSEVIRISKSTSKSICVWCTVFNEQALKTTPWYSAVFYSGDVWQMICLGSSWGLFGGGWLSLEEEKISVQHDMERTLIGAGDCHIVYHQSALLPKCHIHAISKHTKKEEPCVRDVSSMIRKRKLEGGTKQLSRLSCKSTACHQPRKIKEQNFFSVSKVLL